MVTGLRLLVTVYKQSSIVDCRGQPTNHLDLYRPTKAFYHSSTIKWREAILNFDQLISKRLADLQQQAEAIQVEISPHAQHLNGDPIYIIPPDKATQWSTSALNLLQRVFGENSVHYQQLLTHYKTFETSSYEEPNFKACLGILRAAKDDYEGGYLFNIRSLVKAEVLDNSLEQAEELLNKGFKDPACVVVGISLEISLKELCSRHSIVHTKLDKMNVDLCKAGVYNMAKQKQITAWAELRNKSAHGDWSAYTDADVKDFLDGVHRFIADYL
jgi:hypothetical protein